MTKNLNVEAEGGELVLQNKTGDIAIIPKDMRAEAIYHMNNGDMNAINEIISGLPDASHYAQSGSKFIRRQDPNEGKVRKRLELWKVKFPEFMSEKGYQRQIDKIPDLIKDAEEFWSKDINRKIALKVINRDDYSGMSDDQIFDSFIEKDRKEYLEKQKYFENKLSEISKLKSELKK